MRNYLKEKENRIRGSGGDVWLWPIFTLVVKEGPNEFFINPIANGKDCIKEGFGPVDDATSFCISKDAKTSHHLQSTSGRHIPAALLVNEELCAKFLSEDNRFPLATVEHPRQLIHGCLIFHGAPLDPCCACDLGSTRPLVSLCPWLINSS